MSLSLDPVDSPISPLEIERPESVQRQTALIESINRVVLLVFSSLGETFSLLMGKVKELFSSGSELSPPVPEEPVSSIKRRYPPLGYNDTIVIKNGELRSHHGKGKLFKDEEILEVSDVVSSCQLKGTGHCTVRARLSSNGKWVVQQMATRGCTAAATAMLCMDHGKTFDVDSLFYRNLAQDSQMLQDLREAGLSPSVTRLNDADPELLSVIQRLLDRRGSAIIGISGELGGHVLVVDKVLQHGVRFRDPYHGWEITVTRNAFLKRLKHTKLIQVGAPP